MGTGSVSSTQKNDPPGAGRIKDGTRVSVGSALRQHHEDAEDDAADAEQGAADCEGGVERGRDVVPLAPRQGRAGRAVDGQRARDDERDARRRRHPDDLNEVMDVDDRGPDHAGASAGGAPPRTRRTPIHASPATRRTPTMSGPTAPCPKMRVKP